MKAVFKRKISLDITHLTILFCLALVYVIPMSSNLNLASPVHGDIYRVLRLGLVALAGLSLLKTRILKGYQLIEYTVLLGILLAQYVLNHEIPFTSMLVFASIILFDQVNTAQTKGVSPKVLSWIFKIQLLQLAVMAGLFFARYGYLEVLNTGKDPNYTAYFLVLLYFMLAKNSTRAWFQPRDILLLLVVLTYSRNGLLAVADRKSVV